MKAQLDLTATAMDEYTQEQHLISQQVQANGEAIARVTLRQMEESKKPAQPQYDEDHHSAAEDVDSLILDDNASFHNVFAKDTMQAKHNHPGNTKQISGNTNRMRRGKTTKAKSTNLIPYLSQQCLKWISLILKVLTQRSG